MSLVCFVNIGTVPVPYLRKKANSTILSHPCGWELQDFECKQRWRPSFWLSLWAPCSHWCLFCVWGSGRGDRPKFFSYLFVYFSKQVVDSVKSSFFMSDIGCNTQFFPMFLDWRTSGSCLVLLISRIWSLLLDIFSDPLRLPETNWRLLFLIVWQSGIVAHSVKQASTIVLLFLMFYWYKFLLFVRIASFLSVRIEIECEIRVLAESTLFPNGVTGPVCFVPKEGHIILRSFL